MKYALITGASMGIGRALAKLLAGQGIHLIVVARSEEKLKRLVQEIGSQVSVHIVVADLADRAQREKVIETIWTYVPDYVFNNAGWGYYGNALTYETEDSMNMLEVNAAALLQLTLESARAMASAGKSGVIMNVSSSAAFQIFPGFSVYAATKSFVNRFSESFDEELKPHGIRVLACCPGIVETHFRYRASNKHEEKPDRIAMTKEFAAKEIWKQVTHLQSLRAFDWKYRVMTFFTTYLLPKRLVVWVLKNRVANLHHKRSMILSRKKK